MFVYVLLATSGERVTGEKGSGRSLVQLLSNGYRRIIRFTPQEIDAGENIIVIIVINGEIVTCTAAPGII